METAIHTLQTEESYYRENQASLEAEINTLLEDNKKLSRQVEVLLKERSEFAVHTSGDRQGNQDGLEIQIALLTKERDSLLQLWQTSQRTIEALDTELKTYQREYYNHEHNPTKYEESRNFGAARDNDTKFNTALEEINSLEKKLAETGLKEKSIAIEMKIKEEEIKSYHERGKMLEENISNILGQLDALKVNLGIEKKNNDNLVSGLEKYKIELDTSVKREQEAKSKVKEALDLLDLVTAQRDDACTRAAAISEELARQCSAGGEAARALEGRLRAELDAVKEKYDEKVEDMLAHVQSLDRELVEKGLLLAKTLRENKVMQKTIQHFEKLHEDAVSSIDPRLTIAEQKLEAAFQELVASERRSIQLVSEKQGLALELRRQGDARARDAKRRDWEAALLRTEIADLKLQIEHLQKSLLETDAMVTKLQSLLSSRSDLKQRMVSSNDEEVTALNAHIQKQIELNKKWRESYVEMTQQLKKRLDDLNEENQRLKSQNSYRDRDLKDSKVS